MEFDTFAEKVVSWTPLAWRIFLYRASYTHPHTHTSVHSVSRPMLIKFI
jgi:hypothetical protein